MTPRPRSSLPGKRSLPLAHRPTVTAGLMWAPVLYATYTPAKTARPHPKLMSSQSLPTPLPLVLGRMALATTPQPSSVSIAVPRTSGRKIAEKSTLSSLSLWAWRRGCAPSGVWGSAARERLHGDDVLRLLPAALALGVVGCLGGGPLGLAAGRVRVGLRAPAVLVPPEDGGDDVDDLRHGGEPAVADLVDQAGAAHHDVLEVEDGLLVGGVGDLHAQVRRGVLERPGQVRLLLDEVDELLEHRAVAVEQVVDHRLGPAVAGGVPVRPPVDRAQAH